jgi:LysM repeat protein
MMSRILRITLQLCLAAALLWPAGLALAQETTPSGPVYIVQPGDTLSSIALRFGVLLADLQAANGISDPNQIIKVGDRLVIPGLEGIEGVLTTQQVPFGETLRSLSLRYQVSEAVLARLNHITNPQELYAGSSLVVPQKDEAPVPGQRLSLAPGQSLLELAILHGSDPYTLAAANGLPGAWAALPGDVLRLPGAPDEGPGALPSAITSIELSALSQGRTAEIRLYSPVSLTLSGDLLGHPLNFFPTAADEYTALQGVHAMLNPGIYPLTLQGALADGTPFGFSQQVLVLDGAYLTRLRLCMWAIRTG